MCVHDAHIKDRGLRQCIYKKFISQLIFFEVVMKVGVAVTLDLYSGGA